MKKVNDILPSILYLLIFTSFIGLIIYSILNFDVVKPKEKVTREYQLNEGVNFIGLDFRSKDRASKILRLNEDIVLIADFDNGKWEKIVKKSSKRPILFNNFLLKEYKGYLVVVDKDTLLILEGKKRKEDVKYRLDDGWNLIGAVNYGTSTDLVSEIENKDINVLGVANWSDSLGTFLNFKSLDNKVFGEDFTIEKQDGVFIKVENK